MKYIPKNAPWRVLFFVFYDDKEKKLTNLYFLVNIYVLTLTNTIKKKTQVCPLTKSQLWLAKNRRCQMTQKNTIYENEKLISSIRRAVAAFEGNNNFCYMNDKIKIILERLNREDEACKKAANIIENSPLSGTVMKITKFDYVVPEVIENDSVIQISWLTGVAKLVCTMLADVGLHMNITSKTLRLGRNVKEGEDRDFSLIIIS